MRVSGVLCFGVAELGQGNPSWQASNLRQTTVAADGGYLPSVAAPVLPTASGHLPEDCLETNLRCYSNGGQSACWAARARLSM